MRPEKIHPDVSPQENRIFFPATAEEVIYGGDVDRCRLSLGPETVVVVKHQRRASETPHTVGEKVIASWDERDVVLFAAALEDALPWRDRRPPIHIAN